MRRRGFAWIYTIPGLHNMLFIDISSGGIDHLAIFPPGNQLPDEDQCTTDPVIGHWSLVACQEAAPHRIRDFSSYSVVVDLGIRPHRVKSRRETRSRPKLRRTLPLCNLHMPKIQIISWHPAASGHGPTPFSFWYLICHTRNFTGSR